jgi:hypothetical protein
MPSSEIVLWILKFVIGPVVALVITLTLSDTLKIWLAPLVTKFGSKRDWGVTGRWLATFNWGSNNHAYVECIEVSILFGVVVGRVVPHADNYPTLKSVEHEHPLRLRGTIVDNRYFTGTWFHPLKRSHYHGAFELIVDQDGQSMRGMWLGYSESKNEIEGGEWQWVRTE